MVCRSDAQTLRTSTQAAVQPTSPIVSLATPFEQAAAQRFPPSIPSPGKKIQTASVQHVDAPVRPPADASAYSSRAQSSELSVKGLQVCPHLPFPQSCTPSKHDQVVLDMCASSCLASGEVAVASLGLLGPVAQWPVLLLMASNPCMFTRSQLRATCSGAATPIVVSPCQEPTECNVALCSRSLEQICVALLQDPQRLGSRKNSHSLLESLRTSQSQVGLCTK